MSTRSWMSWAVVGSLAGLSPGDPIGPSRSPQATEPQAPAVPVADRFKDSLERWRGGEDDALRDLASAANELSAAGRPDAARIVASYRSLSMADRAEGLRTERRVNELRGRLNAAYDEGLSGEDWEAVRVPIEADLEELWTASRGLVDRGARGQVSALRAEYRVARLEGSRGAHLDLEERETVAEQVECDARDALADFEAFGLMRPALSARSSQARIDHFLGRLGKARAAYEALADGGKAIGNSEIVCDAYQGLLAIARDRGDEIEVDRCLESLAAMRDANEDWPLARAWAMRLIHDDRPGEAREFLDKFRPPPRSDASLDARRVRRELAYVRALACLRLGDVGMAGELARTESDDPATLASADFQSVFLEARIALASGDARGAIARLRPDGLERLGARDEGAARTLIGAARLAANDPRSAKSELERALDLAEKMRLRALTETLSSTEESKRFNLIGEWEGAGLEAVALLARADLQLEDAANAALASEDWQSRSLRDDDELLTRVRARAGETSTSERLNLAQLESWAGSFELGLVTWVFGADSGAVIHVRRAQGGGLDCAGEPIDLGRERVREGIRRLRECVMSGQDASELAREIGNTLIPETIRARIGRPKSKADRLLFLLHGPLEAWPAELSSCQDTKFDEALTLVVLPGLPDSLPGRAPAKGELARWKLLGSPVDGAQNEGTPVVLLPGAAEELAQLARLHPDAEVIQGAEFQPQAFELALRSSECLHISTHLQAKPGEPRSRFPAAGLRLDDGVVASARQIADLAPRSPLVVLSVCESGGGLYADGEGLFGVARAFLEGGTRDLVVTLWPVDDVAAKNFSLAFHNALAEGIAPSEATRRARTKLRADGWTSADWAAFRFLGRD